MSNHIKFASDIAYQTGELLLEYFKAANLETHQKVDRSVVTEADYAAERLIMDAIREHYPNEAILSEEMQGVFSYDANQPVWIIDPLDGTTNFSLGLHIWGMLITRLKAGWPEMTVMYFPLIDELYHAQHGEGAYFNGERIHSRLPEQQRSLSFFACCSRTFRRYRVSIPYKVRILGSAAYSFCALARGMALIAFEATPKIWDIAGAWLLARESSGVIETLDGSVPFPLISGLDYTRLNFPLLGAPNIELMEKSREQINLN
ncbi:MAG: inositol monophosphatase family protein [Chloroflexota bacterium]|nr:inositol monophosphatase family protein [Chloroflexota bacterium]